MCAECWGLRGLKESELDSSHAWPGLQTVNDTELSQLEVDSTCRAHSGQLLQESLSTYFGWQVDSNRLANWDGASQDRNTEGFSDAHSKQVEAYAPVRSS